MLLFAVVLGYGKVFADVHAIVGSDIFGIVVVLDVVVDDDVAVAVVGGAGVVGVVGW